MKHITLHYILNIKKNKYNINRGKKGLFLLLNGKEKPFRNTIKKKIGIFLFLYIGRKKRFLSRSNLSVEGFFLG